MELKKENRNVVKNENNYKLVAPDGGWGYAIFAAMEVTICVTVVPLNAFGLIYGDFLKNIGDEATGAALSNGLFSTVNSFTGLLANALLRRYSYRKVGLAGSILYVLGGVALIFVQNLVHLLLFFGIIQGIGFGLMLPSVITAFKSYFDKKIQTMQSASSFLIVTINIIVPQIVAWSMKTFGFRGTLIGLAIISCMCVPVMASLQPVKHHIRKVFIQTKKITSISINNSDQTTKSLPEDIPQLQDNLEPLFNQGTHLATSQGSIHSYHDSNDSKRKSIIPLGNLVTSATNNNEGSDVKEEIYVSIKEKYLSFWSSFVNSMDMSLFKEFKYLNICIGLALCFSADIMFISLIPMMMGKLGFDSQGIATLMSVYFGCDLVSRILLTFISYVMTFRSRYLILVASAFTAMARIALLFYDSYMWNLILLGILGFLRCLVQTPMMLVLVEEYSDNFSSAFTLSMVISGVVNLVMGPTISFVKSYTQNDIMVYHVLTLAYIICVVSWTAEFTFCRKKIKNKNDNIEN